MKWHQDLMERRLFLSEIVAYLLLSIWVLLSTISALWLGKKLFPRVSAFILFLLWMAKIAAGSAIWFIYSSYYSDEKTGDIISYHSDGHTLLYVWYDNPLKYVSVLLGLNDNHEEDYAPLYNNMRYWYEEWRGSNLIIESRNMIRLSSLVALVTGGLPLAHTFFFSWLAFIGALMLVKGFHEAGIKTSPVILLTATVMCPSVLAWTSAAMREAPMMLGLGLAVAGSVKLKNEKWRWGCIFLSAGLWWLVYFKTHVALTLFTPLVVYLLSGRRRNRIILTYAIAAVVLLGVLYGTSFGDTVLHVVAKKRIDFINVAEVWEARSRIPVPEVPRRLSQVPASALQALTNTFLQPFPWRVRGLLDSVAVTENILLTSLAIWALFKRRFFSGTPLDFALMVLSFSLLQGLLIGYTTSVAGAIVRYKVSILALLVPFLSISVEGLSQKIGISIRTGESQ
jgi:hypothetical protein